MSDPIDLLLGKIALEKGYITRRQLDDCIMAQEREQRETGALRPLGEIMLAQGIIDEATLQELITRQQEKFRKAAEFSETHREDDIFGKLLVQRNLLPAEKVNECLRIQAQMAERDVHLRLGEVLVKKGFLTVTQVREVLLLQRKVIMTCQTCKKNYNVPGRKEGMTVRCPKCSTVLRPSDLSQTISAVGTTHPEANSKAAQPPPAAKAATGFGRYDLLEELGEGGMGIVYKAWDKELRRLVALKMLKTSDGEGDSRQVERFLREARASAQLRHPNIVQIYDVGAVEDKHYFTMDFIEGGSLHELMSGSVPDPGKHAEQVELSQGPSARRSTDSGVRRMKPARLALRRGLDILHDIAFALAHAHAQGIVHRDIKPANILIDSAGVPYLTDFGLAKDIRHLEKSGLTIDGQVIGTPFYLSPELAAGEKSRLGPASDIYSMGVIMYELLTGKKPYEADSFIALMWEIMHKDPPAPRSLSARTHRDLETICLKAMEKDPARRYASAQEFGEDIRRYLTGEAIAARPAGRLYRAWRAVRRHAAVSVGVAAAVLALGVGGGYFLYTSAMHKADARSGFTKGIGLMEKGDWNAALDRLQAAALLDPGNADIAARIDECKQRMAQSGEIAGAERRKAASRPYERAKAKVDRIDELAKVGDFKKGTADLQSTLPDLEEAVAQDPSFAEPLFLKGRVLGLLGRQDEALSALQKAIKLNPTFAAPYLEKASILLEKYSALVQPQVNTVLSIAIGEPGAPVQDSKLTVERTLDSDKLAGLKAEIEATLRKAIALGVRAEETHCCQGVLLSLEGKVSEALAEFDKAIGIYEYYADAYRRRGFAYLVAGDVKRALQDFDKAIEYRPFSPEAYVFRGNAHTIVANHDAAVADYTKAIGMRPEFTKAITNRGKSLVTLGRIEEALRDLNKSMDLDPENPDIYSTRAYAFLVSNRIPEGLKDAEKAYGMKPEELNNINILGMARGLSGDIEGGIKLLSEGIARFPKSTMLLENRSLLYERKNNLDMALADTEKICELTPGRTEPILRRSRLLREKRSLDAALSVMDAALAKNDGVASFFEERATIFVLKGDFARARADIDKALQVDPKHAASYVERARIKLHDGDVTGAEADLAAAVKANPKRVEAYILRGKLRNARKDLKGAVEEYSAGLKEVPGDPNLLFERGSANAALDEFDGALADFTEIIRRDKKNVMAFIARAKVNWMKLHLDHALLDVESALALDDKLAEGYSLRGDCYREKGNLAKAQISYEKAIELAPDVGIPHAGLGLVHMNEGRFDKAAECFKTFLRLAPDHPWVADIKHLLAEAEKMRDGK
jgi:serine/threonine-protein kinase